MSAESNKYLFRRYFAEGTNKGDLSVIEEAFAVDYVHHDPAALDIVIGLDAVKHHIMTLRNAFPDLEFQINDSVADDDNVVVRWTVVGTHTGDYFGMPGTGKSFAVTGMNHWKIKDGKAVEGWVSRDDMGLMRQLDMMG